MMENRWSPIGKIFPILTTFDLLAQIQEFMKEHKCDPEQFKGRIIFMSMFNDIVWKKKEMKRNVEIMLPKLRIMLADFFAVMVILGTWIRKEMVRNLF